MMKGIGSEDICSLIYKKKQDKMEKKTYVVVQSSIFLCHQCICGQIQIVKY